jgi:hypothetical protein
MSAQKLNGMLKNKRKLDAELRALVDRRSLLTTEAERLKLIPDAVRITGAMAKVQKQIEKHRAARRTRRT